MPRRLILPPKRDGRPHLVVRLISYLLILGVSADLAYLTFTGLLAADFRIETAGDLAVVVFMVSLALGVLTYFSWYFASQMKGARLDLVTVALMLQKTSNLSSGTLRPPTAWRTRRSDVRLRPMLRRTRKCG